MTSIVEHMNKSLKVGYLYLTLGFLCIVICIFVSINTYSFLKSADSAEGVVVELVKKHPSKSSLYPKVEFNDLNGNLIIFTSNVGYGASINTYKEGDVIKVLYQNGLDDSARVSSIFSLWGISLLLLIVGGGFMFTSIRQIIMLNRTNVVNVT
jgi:hypothetical protein